MDSPPHPLFFSFTISGLLSVHMYINLKQADKTIATPEIHVLILFKHRLSTPLNPSADAIGRTNYLASVITWVEGMYSVF